MTRRAADAVYIRHDTLVACTAGGRWRIVGSGYDGVSVAADRLVAARRSGSGAVELWNVSLRRRERVLRCRDSDLVVLSLDGKRIAVGFPGKVLVLDIATGCHVCEVAARRAWDRVETVAFAPDGSHVAVSWSGRPLWIVDAESGKLLQELRDRDSPGYMRSPYDDALALTFSADGAALAAGYGDGRVVLWECPKIFPSVELVAAPGARSGEGLSRRQPAYPPSAHSGPVRAIASSRDGECVATAGEDCVIRIWKPSTAELLLTLGSPPDDARIVAVAPPGGTAACAYGSGKILVWERPWERGPIVRYSRPSGPPESLALSDGERGVLTVADRNAMDAWGLRPFERVGLCAASGGTLAAVATAGGGWVVESLRFSGEQGPGMGLTARRWRHSGSEPDWEIRLEGPIYLRTPSVRQLAVSGSEELLAASVNGGLWLWKVQGTGAGRVVLRSWEGRQELSVGVVALSSDGSTIAVSCPEEEHLVFVGNVFSGVWRTFALRNAVPCSLALSSDGSLVAVGTGFSRLVHVYGKAGELVATCAGHRNGVTSMVFQPHADVIVTGGQDGLVQLWDLKSDAITTLPPE